MGILVQERNRSSFGMKEQDEKRWLKEGDENLLNMPFVVATPTIDSTNECSDSTESNLGNSVNSLVL